MISERRGRFSETDHSQMEDPTRGMPPTIHASAVLFGARAVLIQGPSGSGKSRLALALLQAAASGTVRFARLVADDRAQVEAAHGRLLVRPAPALAGMIEVRGLGIRRLPHEPVAVAGALVELGLPQADRMPEPCNQEAAIAGVRLPRLAVAASQDGLPLVLAFLQTALVHRP
jgi:serine kinase of HPr protein (carbohydrate metabolism regulator)